MYIIFKPRTYTYARKERLGKHGTTFIGGPRQTGVHTLSVTLLTRNFSCQEEMKILKKWEGEKRKKQVNK